jgi:hypothetical protein
MATAFVTEYFRLSKDANGGRVAAGKEPANTTQSITFSSSTQSAAFQASTSVIRIWVSSQAHVKVGANPTADANDTPLSAKNPEYFGVNPGDKIAIFEGSL